MFIFNFHLGAKMELSSFLGSKPVEVWIRFGGGISFAFWIFCLFRWNKQKDNIISLILLLLLNVIYTPFYYLRIKKRHSFS